MYYVIMEIAMEIAHYRGSKWIIMFIIILDLVDGIYLNILKVKIKMEIEDDDIYYIEVSFCVNISFRARRNLR